jgi:hypothetical protein
MCTATAYVTFQIYDLAGHDTNHGGSGTLCYPPTTRGTPFTANDCGLEGRLSLAGLQDGQYLATMDHRACLYGPHPLTLEVHVCGARVTAQPQAA